MDWVSTGVVGIVIIGGLLLFYKVLKEPLDLLFSFIGRGLGWVGEGIRGIGSSARYTEVIRYG